MKWDTAGWIWLLVQFSPILFVCCSCFHVAARSMDSDHDVQGGKKATRVPHQSAGPIKSWWQRENRESPPCLMCVATEKEREKSSRLCTCNYCIVNFHKLSDISTANLSCHSFICNSCYSCQPQILWMEHLVFFLSIMKEQPVSCLCIFIMFFKTSSASAN